MTNVGTTSGPEAHDLMQPMRATLQGIAALVAPTSLVTALVYYFGWARTNQQATLLGLDDSLLGYSTKDYLLRSVDAMFWPLFIGTLVTTGALLGHAAIVAWATGSRSGGEPPSALRRRRVLRWAIPVLVTCGLTGLLLGVAGARVQKPSRLVSMATPICVTAGLVLIGYAAHLGRRLSAGEHRSPCPPELKTIRVLASSLMFALILLNLFWTVSRYAVIKGFDLALAVEDALPSLPYVTIYSPTRLHLQPPVHEERLAGEDSAYRFSYTGLTLLFRADGKFFLRPSDESANGVNIVIPDRDDIRLELIGPQLSRR